MPPAATYKPLLTFRGLLLWAPLPLLLRQKGPADSFIAAYCESNIIWKRRKPDQGLKGDSLRPKLVLLGLAQRERALSSPGPTLRHGCPLSGGRQRVSNALTVRKEQGALDDSQRQFSEERPQSSLLPERNAPIPPSFFPRTSCVRLALPSVQCCVRAQ